MNTMNTVQIKMPYLKPKIKGTGVVTRNGEVITKLQEPTLSTGANPILGEIVA